MGHQPSHIFITHLLLCMRHLPSHTYSMGHSFFPFLAAFIAHYISHHYGVYQFTRGTFPSCFIMGYLVFPFNNSLDSWGTYPSHSHFCSSNISHIWHTWSLTPFLLTALKISQVRFIAFETSVSFLFIFTDSCLSLLFLNAFHHGALNHPICIAWVGHLSFPLLKTVKYTIV